MNAAKPVHKVNVESLDRAFGLISAHLMRITSSAELSCLNRERAQLVEGVDVSTCIDRLQHQIDALFEALSSYPGETQISYLPRDPKHFPPEDCYQVTVVFAESSSLFSYISECKRQWHMAHGSTPQRTIREDLQIAVDGLGASFRDWLALGTECTHVSHEEGEILLAAARDLQEKMQSHIDAIPD